MATQQSQQRGKILHACLRYKKSNLWPLRDFYGHPDSASLRRSRPLGRSYLSTMESLPPPPNADGLLFVLSGAQCDQAMPAPRRRQRAAVIDGEIGPRWPAGLPLRPDARLLHGPAAPPVRTNLDGANSRLPAQPASRRSRLHPLPEADGPTCCTRASSAAAKAGGRWAVEHRRRRHRRPAAPALVLNHHGLLA